MLKTQRRMTRLKTKRKKVGSLTFIGNFVFPVYIKSQMEKIGQQTMFSTDLELFKQLRASQRVSTSQSINLIG